MFEVINSDVQILCFKNAISLFQIRAGVIFTIVWEKNNDDFYFH